MAALIAFRPAPASADDSATNAGVLRVGDQRAGSKALMEAAGVLDGVPYRIDWKIFPAAAQLLEALNADAIDAGGVGDAPFTFARAAGVPLKVALVWRSSGAGIAMVVPGTSPIRSLADLKGKTIGTGRGSAGHYLTLAVLEQAGLQPGDVKIAFLTPVDAGVALNRGAVDAWATWSYYVYLATLNNGGRILIDGRGLMSGLFYYVARDTAIAGKKPLLIDFLRRLVKAQAWANDHLDDYAKVWAKETRISVDVAKATLEAEIRTAVPIDDRVIALQQRNNEVYAGARVIPRVPDAAPGFDASFNDPVLGRSGL